MATVLSVQAIVDDYTAVSDEINALFTANSINSTNLINLSVNTFGNGKIIINNLYF